MRNKNLELRKSLISKHYSDQFEQLARTLFVWDGLPEGMPKNYIEKMLFDRGTLLFIEDPLLGFIALPYAATKYNIYGEPIEFEVRSTTATNEFSARYTIDQVEIIDNNLTRTPTRKMIAKNIEELVELDLTKRQNMVWQRLPFVFKGDAKTVQSYRSLIEGAEKGMQPVVVADSSLNLEGVELMDTRTQYLGGELREEYKMIVGELLTTLGIDNLDIMKKERMVVSEVEVNEQEVNINLVSYLYPRLQAIERINKKWGLNLSVEVNPELKKSEVLMNENDNVEGDEREVRD